MRNIIAALTLAAGLLALSAHATEAAMTAADLKELCSGSDHVSRNVCRTYILGVTEGISQGLSIAAGKSAKACIPEGVSAEHLEKTIKAEKPWKSGTLMRPAKPGIFDLSQATGNVIGVLPRILKS